jgi:hypothetical protein
LAELVIPGVVLHRVTEKVARIELEDAPVALNVDEDVFVELRFALKNGGTQETEFQVTVVNNLGEPLWEQQGKLAAAAKLPVTVPVEGKYRTGADHQEDAAGTLKAVTVRVRHTALDGKWRESLDGPTTIPVKVNPKKTKLDVDALKSFDDL